MLKFLNNFNFFFKRLAVYPLFPHYKRSYCAKIFFCYYLFEAFSRSLVELRTVATLRYSRAIREPYIHLSGGVGVCVCVIALAGRALNERHRGTSAQIFLCPEDLVYTCRILTNSTTLGT